MKTQITFRGLDHSDAVKDHIVEKVSKLPHFFDNITSCHVVVELENKNKQHGNLHNTRITLSVPKKELISNRNENKDMYLSIRTAFDDLTRQLEEYAREMRDANHQPMMYGKIVRIFNGDGYGFIEAEDGTEFYFNANHVSHPDFHKLAVGMPVHFVHESGREGPQAHRVKLAS